MNNFESQISRQPSTKDPDELRIRMLLEKLLSTDFSKRMVRNLTTEQEEFFASSLVNLQKPERIEKKYRELLEKLATISKSHIISGQENLEKVKDKPHIIIATNHFGSAKLTRIPIRNLGLDLPLEEIEPFPIRHAPFVTIEKVLNGKIFECAVELPQPFLGIQLASGILTIPTSGEGRSQKLTEKILAVNKNEPKTLIVMYPEGGTSGKRNHGGPFDLDEFHTGTLVVAANLDIPILPVIQKLNPETGIELSVMEPLYVSKDQLKDSKSILENLKNKMQEELKSKN